LGPAGAEEKETLYKIGPGGHRRGPTAAATHLHGGGGLGLHGGQQQHPLQRQQHQQHGGRPIKPFFLRRNKLDRTFAA
jgi:hypothetical protein